MPSLIDLRRRIRSIKSTQQVTKAMKMVAAAKLRRAQDRVVAARPYAAMLRRVLADVAAAARTNERLAHPLLAQRPEERIQLVFLTADRGLAGAFNSNLIRGAQQFLAEHAGQEVRMEIVGRKGRDFFRKRGAAISGEYIGISERVTYADAQAIAQAVSSRFAAAEVDAVYLLYNEFKSVLSQRLTLERILPVAVPEELDNIEYLYEQPPEELLPQLLSRYVEIQIYHALLESAAAQQAARMTAMDAATTNAAEMIDKLTLYMNRVRQASITKEIIEVVSGAAAIE
ncbi:MAG: ATP synthase F1 subunit gamma [Bryobacterales bacterium]|nr:ATP synthase F1 subunit gamma [Bryobacteraceae bacterium]MDW8353058.1 ATP synthase F1 subunit gamma [Bryobacterales bacterium]